MRKKRHPKKFLKKSIVVLVFLIFIGLLLFVFYSGDDYIIPVLGDDCVSCKGSCESCNTEGCFLDNAYWSSDSVVIGNIIKMVVEGENCSGKYVNYSIIKRGDLGWNPFNWFDHEIFLGTTNSSVNWIAGRRVDGITRYGKYYFEVVDYSGFSGKVVSPDLLVEAIVGFCGDEICGEQEDCNNCDFDCGKC